MTSFEIEGKLVVKYPTENKSSSFQAREFVIEADSGNYPQFIKFQLVQERCALIEDFNEGDLIKVHFDLRGREWNGKYFTNLNAWRIERPAQQANSAPPPAAANDFPSANDEPSTSLEFEDDLPF